MTWSFFSCFQSKSYNHSRVVDGLEFVGRVKKKALAQAEYQGARDRVSYIWPALAIAFPHFRPWQRHVIKSGCACVCSVSVTSNNAYNMQAHQQHIFNKRFLEKFCTQACTCQTFRLPGARFWKWCPLYLTSTNSRFLDEWEWIYQCSKKS